MKSPYFFIGLIIVSFLIVPVASANFTYKWSHDFPDGTETLIPPVAADVTRDGYYEVIMTGYGSDNPDGKGWVFCFDHEGNILWKFLNPNGHGTISRHAPPFIADLDNDGNYEVVVPAYGNLIVLNAEDGTLFWENEDISAMEKHLTVVDADNNGFPYIYVSMHRGYDGVGSLYKVEGRTGSVVKEVPIYYPCQGGLASADLEGDGKYEIILNERNANSPGPGKGVACFDADTLNVLWYHDDILCSSHTSSIIDVNNDGILDVIAMQQSGGSSGNGGICIVDGATGLKWKYDGNLGLYTHHQLTAYDIDLDGNVEIIYSADAHNNAGTTVWDVVNWEREALLQTGGKSPEVANVLGDERLEIIIGRSSPPTYIYDHNYNLVDTIEADGARTLVQDLDNDGLNEIVLQDSDGDLVVFDTEAKTPSPKSVTNSPYHGGRNTGAEVYYKPNGGVIPDVGQFPITIILAIVIVALLVFILFKRGLIRI